MELDMKQRINSALSSAIISIDALVSEAEEKASVLQQKIKTLLGASLNTHQFDVSPVQFDATTYSGCSRRSPG